MSERRSTLLEPITIAPGDIFKVSPDLEHPEPMLGWHPDYRRLDEIHVYSPDFFEGSPFSAVIDISEFQPKGEKGRFLTPTGRSRQRLPIQINVTTGHLTVSESEALQALLFYRGVLFEIPLSGDTTLLERQEAHHYKSWNGLIDPRKNRRLWAQFQREPNLFEENIRFCFRLKHPVGN